MLYSVSEGTRKQKLFSSSFGGVHLAPLISWLQKRKQTVERAIFATANWVNDERKNFSPLSLCSVLLIRATRWLWRFETRVDRRTISEVVEPLHSPCFICDYKSEPFAVCEREREMKNKEWKREAGCCSRQTHRDRERGERERRNVLRAVPTVTLTKGSDRFFRFFPLLRSFHSQKLLSLSLHQAIGARGHKSMKEH